MDIKEKDSIDKYKSWPKFFNRDSIENTEFRKGLKLNKAKKL